MLVGHYIFAFILKILIIFKRVFKEKDVVGGRAVILFLFQKGHSEHRGENDLEKGKRGGEDPSYETIAVVQIREGEVWIIVVTVEVEIKYNTF